MNLPKVLRKFPYWYLIAIPVLLTSMGIASNQAVLVANHGKFPVMLNQTWKDHFCRLGPDEDASDYIPASCKVGGEMLDDVHSVMGPNSHLKVLADIFPLGHDIFSIGDGFISLGLWLLSFTPIAWLFLTLKKLAALIP